MSGSNTDKQQKGIEWGRVISVLIANGHSFSDVKKYTVDQMLLFYSHIIREKIEYIRDTRIAVWGSEKDLDQYVSDTIKR